MKTDAGVVLQLFVEFEPVAIGISKIQQRLGCGYVEGRAHVDLLLARNEIVHIGDGLYIPKAKSGAA